MTARKDYDSYAPFVPAWTNFLVAFVAGTLAGGLGGYALGAQSGPARTAPAPAVAAVSPVSPAAPLVNEQELQSFRNVLASDPKNIGAAIELGNRLYDAGRFTEAVPYYQQAFALNPKDVSVSTDLGTSLWNAGRVDEALAQFDVSLKLDPKHPQTLFNLGIVRLHGKNDGAGAASAWERLLDANPSYPEQARVREMIAKAKAVS